MVYVLAFAIDKKKEGSFFHPLHSQRTATKLEGYRATSNGSVSEWLGMPGIGRNFHVIIILLGGKAPKTAPNHLRRNVLSMYFPSLSSYLSYHISPLLFFRSSLLV